jgi:hypothetical protein
MNLQGTDVEKLVNAMLKAYPEQCQLEEMVLYRLDENLAAIVPSSNSTLRFIIFKLIQWAEANGTIRDLLCAISEDRPDNSELRTVINNLLITSDWINLLNDSYLTRFHPLIEELKKSSYPNIPNRFGLSKSQEIIEVFQNISHSLESGDNFRSVFITSRDILITIDPLNEEYLEHFCNKINIVLLVMNNSEAQELYSESVFSDYNIELRENFRNLKLQLTNNGVITWVNYYKSDSTQWQPFNSDSRNITQLINEVIEQVESESIIVSQFIDIRRLNEDNPNSLKLLKKLRDEGCIIIMDVISMQHPEMQRLFKSTALDASSNTLLLMVAPIHSAFDVVRSITGVIKQRIDIEFHRRLLWNDSKWMKAADNDIFRNWLIGKVPSLLLVPETENVTENVFRPWDNYGKGG